MGKRGFRRGWRELSFSLSQHYTSFWLIPILYMYIVEDVLGDKLTKRLELEINKKGGKGGKNERCGGIDKLCGERISSYSKEGSNLLGSRFLILQSRMHARLSVHPPVCLCPSVHPCL